MEAEELRRLLAGLTTQQVLWFHWLRSFERLRALGIATSNRPPLNQNTPYSPERRRQADAIAEGHKVLNARILRIERYLGHMRPETGAPSALETVKTIRANIERGDSDEAIALFLEKWHEPELKRGRPHGSNDSESVYVLAHQLREGDPKLWTWPKLADTLLGCKSHVPHASESECVTRMRQADSRLRKFLQELERD